MTYGRCSTFHLVLIKPSRYDDDGYPIRWARTLIPSNTLTVLYGLAADAARRQVLGPGVGIEISPFDDTNRRADPGGLLRRIRRDGGRALVMLVGVQTNQFPRAIDIARPFLAEGLPVILGGFHVSGCASMLDEMPQDIKAAQEMGVSLFLGEAEERRLDEVLLDAWNGRLKTVYDHMKALPSIGSEPTPHLPKALVERVFTAMSCFDLGRGCPYQCSFCTIINVQGRKSRVRTPDDLERIVRESDAQGIRNFFITDDNFARNSRWEELLDRLIMLRENDGIRVQLLIQVDVQCHKVPRFIDKCARAGVRRVFIGLENINPDNLVAAKKNQNKITDYRAMLQQWKRHGIIIYAGYITGFPGDTKDSILRDIEIIKRELPIDCLEFFYLTPLPGSEDHRRMLDQGVWMDPDMNRYNLDHRVTHHERMSDAEWDEAYYSAWRSYYTREHVETAARRHAAMAGRDARRVVKYMYEFKLLIEVEKVHPLEGGVFRKKSRLERRHGLPVEDPVTFYSKYAWEIVRKHLHYAKLLIDAKRIIRRVERARDCDRYADRSITADVAEDLDRLELFTETRGGGKAVSLQRRKDALRVEFGGSGSGTDRATQAVDAKA